MIDSNNGQIGEQQMTSWVSKHIGTAITLLLLGSAIVSSWAVAQYQILEIRAELVKINHRFDELPPGEWKYRIITVENIVSRTEKTLNEVSGDIRELKARAMLDKPKP